MKDKKIYRILIAGPESTGKTSLTQELAMRYSTVWAAEFARAYLDAKVDLAGISATSTDLISPADIIPIILGQAAQEIHLENLAKQCLFCDAGTLSTEVYAQHYFGQAPQQLESIIQKHSYDYCLLTATDLPWEADWQRAEPHRREELFQRFEQALGYYQIPYGLVTGKGDERVQNAVFLVKKWLQA